MKSIVLKLDQKQNKKTKEQKSFFGCKVYCVLKMCKLYLTFANLTDTGTEEVTDICTFSARFQGIDTFVHIGANKA